MQSCNSSRSCEVPAHGVDAVRAKLDQGLSCNVNGIDKLECAEARKNKAVNLDLCWIFRKLSWPGRLHVLLSKE